MKELIETFREYEMELNKSERTVESYVTEVELLARDFIKNIDDLKLLEQKEFAKEWLKEMNEKYSPGTVNKKMTAISVFANYLIFEGYIESNIFKKLDKIKSNNKKVETYSDNDMKRILDLLDEKCNRNYKRKIDKQVMVMWKAMFNIYYNTAIRNEECTKIEIQDLDFETGKLYVRAKGHHGKISHVSKLNEYTLNLVKDYYEIRKNIEVKDENKNLLFISPLSKKSVGTNAVRKQLKQLKEELGIENNLLVHSIRHYRGTDLVSKGASIQMVSQFMHHSNIATTEHYYVHSNERMLDELSNM